MGNKKSKLPKSIVNELVGHTKRSPEDIKYMHKIFMQHFPRGRVESPQELHQCLQKFSAIPFDINDQSAQRRLYRIFQQHNEREPIDFFQFMIVSNILEKGSANDRISLFFRSFDVDQDEKISPEDLKACLPNTNLSQTVIEELIDEWDQNGDGFVDYRDFYSYIVNHPTLSTAFGVTKQAVRDRDRIRVDDISTDVQPNESPNVYKVNSNRRQIIALQE